MHYKQLDPVVSPSGFKVLFTTKSPYRDRNGDIAGIIVLCVEITTKEMIELAYLIDRDSPFKNGKSIIISNNDYIYSKFEIKLTPRELECMFFVLRGRSYKRIGKALNISPRTVEEYINKIKFKFNCNSKDELIELAYENSFSRFIPESLINNNLIGSLTS